MFSETVLRVVVPLGERNIRLLFLTLPEIAVGRRLLRPVRS